MSNIIDELRETSREHNQVKKCVDAFIKRAREAAANGDGMAHVWTYNYRQLPVVVAELEKMGFKTCVSPRGNSETYMTWI